MDMDTDMNMDSWSMPALQACRLRHTFVLKVHVAQREELGRWTSAPCKELDVIGHVDEEHGVFVVMLLL